MSDSEIVKLGRPERSQTVLDFLSRRRSNLAKLMSGPGPDKESLDVILKIAARVPDHRKLEPWRFILFQGEARNRFGVQLKTCFLEQNPEASEKDGEFEAQRLMRAPTVVAVISSPKECRRNTPIWEQELSSGAVCFNMLMAAQASGFAAQWLTEWFAYDEKIKKIMSLEKNERVAGFIYLGKAVHDSVERPRPELENIISIY